MKDVKTFLAELDEKAPQPDQWPCRICSASLSRPSARDRAPAQLADRAHQRAFQTSFYWDRVGSPSRDRQEIDFLVDQYINLNWALELEASGVVGLEIEPGLSLAIAYRLDG